MIFFVDASDFRPGFGMVIFAPNQTEACGMVEIKNDDDPETPEVFMVTFEASNLVIPPRTDLPPPIAEVTIIDDDSMYINYVCHILWTTIVHASTLNFRMLLVVETFPVCLLIDHGIHLNVPYGGYISQGKLSPKLLPTYCMKYFCLDGQVITSTM